MVPGSERGREVCAVLVTYHPDAGLPRRVAAIAGQVGGVVIVDNGSGGDALAMLEDVAAQRRSVTLIVNDANAGLARALNQGVERAAALGFAWVLLFDQDSEAGPDLVRGLFAVHDAYPQPQRLAVVGAGYADPSAVPRADAAERSWDEVETAITSGSLIAMAVCRAVGPFREELFIDYIDIDFCRRARARGLAVVTTRRPLMAHAIGAPTRHRLLGFDKWTTNHSPDRRYYIARNDTVMLRESGRYRGGAWALKSLARRLRTCKRVLLYEDAKRAKIAAIWQGWWHGIRNRLGPRPRCGAARPAAGRS